MVGAGLFLWSALDLTAQLYEWITNPVTQFPRPLSSFDKEFQRRYEAKEPIVDARGILLPDMAKLRHTIRGVVNSPNTWSGEERSDEEAEGRRRAQQGIPSPGEGGIKS